MRMFTTRLRLFVLAVTLCLLGGMIAIQGAGAASQTKANRAASQAQPATSNAQATPARPLDQLVDTSAMAYLEVRDIKSQIESLQLLEFFKRFGPLLDDDYQKGLEKAKLLETAWSMLAPLVEGADMAIGVWSPPPVKAAPASKKGAAPARKKRAGSAPTRSAANNKDPLVAVLIKFTSPDNLLLALEKQSELEQAFARLSGKKENELGITFASLHDTLVAGDREVVNRIVTARGPVKSLAGELDYVAARARLADSPVFLYVNLGRATELVDDVAKKANVGAVADVLDMSRLVDLKQSPKIAAGLQFHQTQTIIKALALDRQTASTTRGLWNLFKSGQNGLRAAQWLPPSTDFAVTLMPDWQTLYDLIVPIVNTMAGAKEGSGSLIPMVELMLGYRIRDQILPALGGITISLDSLDFLLEATIQQKSPLPTNLNVLLELRNREVIEGVIKNLTRIMSAEQSTTSTSLREGDVDIQKLGDGGYSIIGNFLAFNPNLDGLRQLIRERKSGRSLAADTDFLRAMQGMPQDLAVWAYVSSAALNDLFEALRKEAIAEEPRLAHALSPFRASSEPVVIGSWRENSDLVSEARLPTGILPLIVASGIASDKARERDRAIDEKVRRVLDELALQSVQTSVKRGVVTLYGTVKTEQEKALAQQRVQKIDGVKSVVNEIVVEPEQ
ncbi:MAG: BON domain-containing protein [Acidobacteriota bacterium]|nr:BON domain-containing protein [Blastocatellia bacterium]MDW8240490.1 BON domain-containing protein [Acidobacteriota bacterium]